MTNDEAIEILQEYIFWRKGAETPMIDPVKIGMALDIALLAMKENWDKMESDKAITSLTYLLNQIRRLLIAVSKKLIDWMRIKSSRSTLMQTNTTCTHRIVNG